MQNKLLQKKSKWTTELTGTVGVVGAGGQFSAAGVARTEVCETVVATDWLHISSVALTAKVTGCCQVHLEWLSSRTGTNKNSSFQVHIENVWLYWVQTLLNLLGSCNKVNYQLSGWQSRQGQHFKFQVKTTLSATLLH